MSADTLRAARDLREALAAIGARNENDILSYDQDNDGIAEVIDCAISVLAGIEAATAAEPAEAAPSDAEIEALDFAIGRLCDDCNPDGSVDQEAARAIGTLAFMRRNRQPADELFLSGQVAKLRAERDISRKKVDESDTLIGQVSVQALEAREALRGLVEASLDFRAQCLRRYQLAPDMSGKECWPPSMRREVTAIDEALRTAREVLDGR